MRIAGIVPVQMFVLVLLLVLDFPGFDYEDDDEDDGFAAIAALHVS
jgi:hypothetical protein